MANENLRINGQRLRASMETMAAIGATAGGGVHRLTLTDEDRKARDLFVQWLRELEIEVAIDDMGNIFGNRRGRRQSLAPVMMGSHIDTQPKGGRFDGILGVMGALEVLRTLREHRIDTPRGIVIANWTNEEGSRFTPAMMGSGVWSGHFDKETIYRHTDINGLRVVDELARIGYRGDRPSAPWLVYAYFEYHIEQGPMLENHGRIIGVPEGIVGIHWFDVQVHGKANQAGPTPMEGRNDALCAAAEMILTVNQLPSKMGGNLVATVGELHNFPNSRNIIPDRVHFTIDMRSWDDTLAATAWSELSRDFEAVAARWGCPLQTEAIMQINHMPFDRRLVRRVRATADMLGHPSLNMRSGAGHDAYYMSLVAPTAMCFVPSIGGRSHAEAENTRWEDCTAGADVLLHCVLSSAMETDDA